MWLSIRVFGVLEISGFIMFIEYIVSYFPFILLYVVVMLLYTKCIPVVFNISIDVVPTRPVVQSTSVAGPYVSILLYFMLFLVLFESLIVIADTLFVLFTTMLL